jgi:hypothetical protein
MKEFLGFMGFATIALAWFTASLVAAIKFVAWAR